MSVLWARMGGGRGGVGVFVVLALVLGVGAGAWGEGVVVVCPVTGMIDEGMSVVVKRAVGEAEARGAAALVFKIDTPGGRVDSAIAIATAMEQAPCLTIAYIEGMGAISAGALISLACDKIVMTPGTNIGAATPVIPTMEGMMPTGEKEVSFVRAKMRALAESKGHNPDLAEAMVDKDIELRGYTNAEGKYVVYGVRHRARDDDEPAPQGPSRPKSPIEEILEGAGVPLTAPESPERPAEGARPEAAEELEPGTVVFEDGSELVLPQGKLLTLTPQEALKYGLIETVAESVEEALSFYGMKDVEYVDITPTWAEKVFRFLTDPTVAGLLLLLGLGGLYFEVQTPGFGFPGIVGLTCLALFFGAHFVLGLTDVMDLVLVGAGLILLAIELFLLPGFGIAGALGILFILIGVYLSLLDFTIPRYSWEFDRLVEALYSLLIALVSFGALLFVSWRFLPRTSLYGRLVLAGTQPVEAGYTVQREEEARAFIGLEGKAISMLRPVGRGRFGDRTLMVMSRGDFLPKGARIRIVQVEGNRYVVEPVKDAG